MSKQVIKKSNDFVEANYSLTLWEMRILIRMLGLIKKVDDDFHEYHVDINDFRTYFGIENDGSVYQRVKQAAKSLMSKTIVIKTKLDNGEVEETEMPMITSVTKNVSRNSYLRLSFHPKMKPYLLQLKSKFLVYDAKNVVKLPSSYAIRVYEITKQYAKIGKRHILVEDFKKMLGVEDKYKQYTHLKQRIIEPSVENVNKHTDISISYKEIKRGRKVHSLEFTVVTKKEFVTTVPTRKMTAGEITKKVNGILYSRPEIQKQITAKHGNVSQTAMNAIVKKMFPEKFK